jgi:hypothetical protein
MKFSETFTNPVLAREAIRRWVAIGIWIIAAMLIADWIATQHILRLAVLAGIAMTIIVAAGLQRSAWLLIVVAWPLKGYINALPVPLAVCDTVILLVTCSYAAQRVVGQAGRHSFGLLDALVAINCAFMVVTFLCHPVGLRALGAETMGARPYFNILIAWCAYWVIVHLPDSYRSVAKVPLWLMVSVTVSTAITATVYLFPSITPYVWYVYGDVDIKDYLEGLKAAGDQLEVHRLTSLGPFGVMLLQCVSSYYPLRTLINPLRLGFYLFLLGFAAVLASGFRSGVLYASACVVLAVWFRGGWRDLILGAVVATVFLGFLVFGQGRLFELPLAAQRALSFLPGQWAEPIGAEVKISNSRFEWWRTVLEERTIKNWWVGDGFGVSETDYELLRGRNGSTEWMTLTGAFHNGPLTTIRYAGVMGLILFYALMIAAARLSVKCVRRCRYTLLFPVAIFLAIQLVWIPIHFTFVFGAFNEQLPEEMFLIGLLLLVWRMSERKPPSPERATAKPMAATW